MSFDIVVVDDEFEHDVIPVFNGDYGEVYFGGVIEE